jgi:hypothetical protein
MLIADMVYRGFHRQRGWVDCVRHCGYDFIGARQPCKCKLDRCDIWSYNVCRSVHGMSASPASHENWHLESLILPGG